MSFGTKKISILGSTGSIGRNALRIVSANRNEFSVEGLTAGSNYKLLAKQILKYRPRYVALKNSSDVEKLKKLISKGKGKLPLILSGEKGIERIAALKSNYIVLSAIVGSAGLRPTFAAVKAGKRVALANKESIVMAGRIMLKEARKSGAILLPVDSEHSAIFQSLKGHNQKEIKRLILTASGGPFLGKKTAFLKKVELKEALEHPNWKMGAKITIDSATLMNKALEVIEARWLFDVSPSNIDVTIHKESIVHSIVEYKDGSMISQMGIPDMRVPISYALTYPKRISMKETCLDLEKVGKLTFIKPDYKSFPAIKFAYRALKGGDSMCVALNAANEASVLAFMEGKIGFLDIMKIIEKALNRHRKTSLKTIDDAISVHENTINYVNKITSES